MKIHTLNRLANRLDSTGKPNYNAIGVGATVLETWESARKLWNP